MIIFRFPSHLQSLFHFLLFAAPLERLAMRSNQTLSEPISSVALFTTSLLATNNIDRGIRKKIDLSSTLLSLSSDLLNLSVYLKGEEWSEWVQLMCIKMMIIHFKPVMHFQKLALARLLSLMELIPQGFLRWHICIVLHIRTREITINITIINIVIIIIIINISRSSSPP